MSRFNFFTESFTLIILILTITSCSKADIEDSETTSCGELNFTNSLLYQSSLSPANPEGEKVNMLLLGTLITVSKLMEDPANRDHLLTVANYQDQEAYLEDFLPSNNMSVSFDILINDIMNCLGYSVTDYDDLISQMIYEGDYYKPSIYFYNINHFTQIDHYYIALGEAANDTDQIAALCISPDSIKEVLLSEEDSTLTYPLLIINNGTDDIAALNEPNGQVFEPYTAKTLGQDIIDEYRLDKRHERRGRSEYSLDRVYFTSSGGFRSGGYRERIRKVKSSDIGSKKFTQDYPLLTLYDGQWFVTFEYDWYASKKFIWVSSDNGSPGGKSVGCRMKWSSGYYHRGVLNYSNSGTLKWDDGRGYLKIKS